MEYTIDEQIRYDSIVSQIEPDKKYHFDYKVNIAVITDRLFGTTDGLCKYLKAYDDISVSRFSSIEQAEKICENFIPDIFIIVGYLKNNKLYNTLKTVKRANPYACTVIYALLDELIDYHKFTYKIEAEFSRFAPIDDFALFLQCIYRKRMAEKEAGVEMVSVEDIPYDPISENMKRRIEELEAQINKKRWWLL